MPSGDRLPGRPLHAGTAVGRTLALDEPLSFWGGYSATDGTIVAEGHPQRGMRAAGHVLVMPNEIGSSSSASVLAEAVRLGTAPAAILTGHSDGILVGGALVGARLYGVAVPIVELAPNDIARLSSGLMVSIGIDGECTVVNTISPR